jgi:predicted nucleic acid-binding protein
MDILIDASVIMSIIIDEPEKELAVKLTKNCVLFSPEITPYEIGNALTRLSKRHILNEKAIIASYNIFKILPVGLLKVDIEKALKLSCKYNIYAYDAYYLEIASRLNLPLLTFDENMKQVGFDMNLDIMEEYNENV